MRKLCDTDFVNLLSGDIVFFVDKFTNKKHKSKIRNIIPSCNKIGWYISFDYIHEIGGKKFISNIINNNIYARHTNMTDFYLPENEKIITQCLHRSMCEILDKYTNTDIGIFLLSENKWL